MNTYIHKVIYTLITSMNWNSSIIKYLFSIFGELKLQAYKLHKKLQAYLIIVYCSIVYRVIAYRLITYKLSPTGY
jgi:hypothetical protein